VHLCVGREGSAVARAAHGCTCTYACLARPHASATHLVGVGPVRVALPHVKRQRPRRLRRRGRRLARSCWCAMWRPRATPTHTRAVGGAMCCCSCLCRCRPGLVAHTTTVQRPPGMRLRVHLQCVIACA
jgi:hypothetical protein